MPVAAFNSPEKLPVAATNSPEKLPVAADSLPPKVAFPWLSIFNWLPSFKPSGFKLMDPSLLLNEFADIFQPPIVPPSA